ncbi:hypothetical protein NMY22_g11441 [Coprinellus aureogranulatus]|nr:hypothetical protein NMY22_g11441 [Coprinellus aureogranulatus]
MTAAISLVGYITGIDTDIEIDSEEVAYHTDCTYLPFSRRSRRAFQRNGPVWKPQDTILLAPWIPGIAFEMDESPPSCRQRFVLVSKRVERQHKERKT